ncbi:VOC family protein [Streptomyces sp. NPDC006879]|uniref:VOC family protein n=1 Tax=Streptomyces sp. NPDC006879 TaxID=3364767 RepID=UPI0036A9992C
MPFTNPVRHITFDALDPYTIAEFWAGATGYVLKDSDPGDEEVLIDPRQQGVPAMLFIRVPDIKKVKNRVHLDIQPSAGTRDEEVDRLLGLGATVVDDQRRGDGSGWVVLADPEGNEFCVERSASERDLDLAGPDAQSSSA